MSGAQRRPPGSGYGTRTPLSVPRHVGSGLHGATAYIPRVLESTGCMSRLVASWPNARHNYDSRSDVDNYAVSPDAACEAEPFLEHVKLDLSMLAGCSHCVEMEFARLVPSNTPSTTAYRCTVWSPRSWQTRHSTEQAALRARKRFGRSCASHACGLLSTDRLCEQRSAWKKPLSYLEKRLADSPRSNLTQSEKAVTVWKLFQLRRTGFPVLL